MKRTATLYRKSKNGKKEFYIDDVNAQVIYDFLKKDDANLKKFRYVVELLLEGRPPRDLYDKENINKKCEHITAIKLFKGKKNPRIYCQQYTEDCKKVFVIIAAELLEKKKSEGQKSKENTTIERVATYQYILRNETE